MSPTRRATLAAGLSLPFLKLPARAARAPATLTFGLSSYPPSFAPWTNVGTAALSVKVQIYRGLVSYTGKGELQGELAESWTRDGDTAWVFRLREASFSNGAPVTAADVKWTLEQVAAEKSTAYLRAELQQVASIETPDPRTVRIVMKQPNAVLPQLLASPHMPIIARPAAEGGAGDVPVGVGPYVMKSQERGVSVDLVANPKYYKPGLPKIANLRFVAYADENLRVAALQSGDIDMIEYVPWQSMAAIEANPALRLETVDGPFMALSFNGAQKPFDNPLVRQAVALAIKREEIVQAAFFGRGDPLEGLPVPKESPFYDATLAQGWRYDSDRAKALLKQAGIAGGFQTTLLATAQYGMHKTTAEIVQQHLAAIGIAVTLNMPDWATRISLGNRGQYDFCVQGTAADSNDPDGLSALVDTSLPANNSRSVNLPVPDIHALFAEGRGEFDAAKRKAIYDKVQRLALAECPVVGLAWRAQGYAMAKDVQGFSNMPGALSFYSCTTLEQTSYGIAT